MFKKCLKNPLCRYLRFAKRLWNAMTFLIEKWLANKKLVASLVYSLMLIKHDVGEVGFSKVSNLINVIL